jgi:hypothetical protein
MRAFVFSLIVAISFSNSIAQPFDQGFLVKKFADHREKMIQEKIFLSTDRQLYLTGELLWFSVRCVDASFHHPSVVSKVAYIELLSRNNSVIAQAKVDLTNGKGSGSFFLPTSLSSDHYVLRSYTHWMRNSQPEFFFHKIIGVVNPFVQVEPVSKTESVSRVDFFAEGGNLIHQVSTRIAFKLSAADMRASLLDEKNDTLVHLIPSVGRVGSFQITPDINKRYRVVIRSKGKAQTQDFLQVNASGYSMRLIDQQTDLEVVIDKRSENINSDEDLMLFTHSRNRMVQLDKKRTLGHQVSFSLKKSQIPDGVTHLTLFNEKGETVCERLYFKKANPFYPTIKVLHSQLGLRKKNSFQISNLPAATSLSVSVTKVDSLSVPLSVSLADYFSLQSDLGGDLIGAEWMQATDEQLDNLMLTHSWKRFSWKSILKDSIANLFLPETRNHLIHATLTDPNGLPKKDATVYFSAPGKLIRFQTEKTDDRGRVSFGVNDFYGNQKVYLQTNRLVDSTSVIKIENPFSEKFALLTIPELKLNPSDEKALLSRSVHMQAQNIFYEEWESKHRLPLIDSLPFYGKADEIYKLDDYTRFTLMEEVMREYVPGVVVRKRKNGFNFIVLDKKRNTLFNEKPLILLDGVPVFDEDEIMQFDPLKVKRLEVVTAKYFYNNLELPGIVSYSTYQGDLAGFNVLSKNGFVDYEGLQMQREFYSPQYSSDRESRMPDPRYLLYWNPHLEVESSKTEVEFFTSDVPGTYMIKVEGLSDKGDPITSTATFVVTKD